MQFLTIVVLWVMTDFGVKIMVRTGCLECSVACRDEFEGTNEVDPRFIVGEK